MPTAYVGGYDPKDSTQSPNPDAKEEHKALGAIPVGSLVAASTADATGQGIIVATAVLGFAADAVGIYAGKGGAGSATTITGLSGNDALTNDMVQIVKRGVVSVRAAAQTLANMVTAGAVALVPSGVTSGWLQEATAGSNLVVGTLWATVIAGGTTTGTQVVVSARVAFR